MYFYLMAQTSWWLAYLHIFCSFLFYLLHLHCYKYQQTLVLVSHFLYDSPHVRQHHLFKDSCSNHLVIFYRYFMLRATAELSLTVDRVLITPCDSRKEKLQSENVCLSCSCTTLDSGFSQKNKCIVKSVFLLPESDIPVIC